MRCLGLVLAATIGLGTSTSAFRTQSFQTLTIQVLAVNQARVPDDIMETAQSAASRIFSAIGITVDWNNVAPQSEEPFWQREGQLKINIVTDWHLKGMSRTLGIAKLSQDDRYMLAYVFYRRIQDHASLLASDVGAVLGYVLSHGIGHLLLRADDTSHSSTGIMREHIDRAQLQRMAEGLRMFSNVQARSIRTQAEALSTRP